jgi:hypothetical protein
LRTAAVPELPASSPPRLWMTLGLAFAAHGVLGLVPSAPRAVPDAVQPEAELESLPEDTAPSPPAGPAVAFAPSEAPSLKAVHPTACGGKAKAVHADDDVDPNLAPALAVPILHGQTADALLEGATRIGADDGTGDGEGEGGGGGRGKGNGAGGGKGAGGSVPVLGRGKGRGAGLLMDRDWSDCGVPSGPDRTFVKLTVRCDERGRPLVVTVLEAPNGEFAAAAKKCAFRHNFAPARDEDGKPTAGSTPPFIVRFIR